VHVRARACQTDGGTEWHWLSDSWLPIVRMQPGGKSTQATAEPDDDDDHDDDTAAAAAAAEAGEEDGWAQAVDGGAGALRPPPVQ
jgi:hypothetical protein